METVLLQADNEGLARAAELLKAGEVVAFPTDTVYGLGCDAFSAAAIEKLYQVKDRDRGKGIPILLSDLSQLSRVAQIPDGEVGERVKKLIEEHWPGALTLILPKHASLPSIISPNNNVAVRVPNHSVALGLLERAGGVLAVTSANISGEAPALTAQEVLASLGSSIAVVVDGGTAPGGLSSTIVDCISGDLQVVRQGPVSLNS